MASGVPEGVAVKRAPTFVDVDVVVVALSRQLHRVKRTEIMTRTSV